MSRVAKLNWKVIVAATTVLISACSTSPTGRSQLTLFPDAQLDASGEQAFEAMKMDQVVSTALQPNRYVRCISNALIQALPAPYNTKDWEVVIFDAEQINAFALPGEKIGVYKGLIQVANNQHQLAAVIGHEIGHVIAKHGNERMSQSSAVGIGQELLGQILAANNISGSQEIMGYLGVGAQVGVILPFSRAHESEADLLGLEYMAKAGFDPREAVKLWQNMKAAADGSRQPELLSTHPSPNTRISDLNSHMAKHLAVYQQQVSRPACE